MFIYLTKLETIHWQSIVSKGLDEAIDEVIGGGIGEAIG